MLCTKLNPHGEEERSPVSNQEARDAIGPWRRQSRDFARPRDLITIVPSHLML